MSFTHPVDRRITCIAHHTLVSQKRAPLRWNAPIANMGDTFDGLAVELVSET